ncbi:F-box/LRR-repeat protein fbxl-1-like [Ixodes scapularis]|uniref:F-box/LRR-repeat protein fbxl-1-like n=1 Tax=Ixodes scapularis TaxID=6945 RepID=UPI001A9D5D06|nr:F-box/LRR-repeat protein fbxl-1-like [Ixodes scapularis]
MAPTLRSRTRIDSLPNEVLEKVFVNLDDASKCKASCVCSKWRDVIYARRKNDVVCIRNIEKVRQCVSFFVRNRVQKYKLRYQTLSELHKTVSVMNLNTRVKIVHLDLSGSTCVIDTAFKKSFARLTSLKWLSLDGCTGIDLHGLRYVLEKMVKLEHLSLKHGNVTFGVLIYMPRMNLQYLDLSYCQFLDNYSVQYPVCCFLNLKTLILDGVQDVSDEVIEMAFIYLSCLETLSVRNCKLVKGIVKTPCPVGFKLLDIRGCDGRHEIDTTIFDAINSRRDGSVLVRFTTPIDSDVSI